MRYLLSDITTVRITYITVHRLRVQVDLYTGTGILFFILYTARVHVYTVLV